MSNSHSQPLNLSGSHPGAISQCSLDSSFNSASSMDKTDLTNPSVLAHLTDCLLFACVTDDTRSLSVRLGLPESLCDRDALSAWILTEHRASNSSMQVPYSITWPINWMPS